MNSNKFWAAVRKTLAVVAVIFIVVLAFAPAAAAASKYKTLYKFTGGSDGRGPWSDLIFDDAGNLYGTTFEGGAYGGGTVFKLVPNPDGSWTENVLYSFTGGDDGGMPTTSLIFDAAGNLYSTTDSGGVYGHGTVFELKPTADGYWTESVLHSFAGGTDGAYPVGGLTIDSPGNLYGTTSTGGQGNCGYEGLPGCGTVFMLTSQQDGSWTESILHRFTGGRDGGYPDHINLVLDAAGRLYGATRNGGLSGACSWGTCGVIFKLTRNSDGSWTERVLHRFNSWTDVRDGGNPEDTLIFDTAGNLYGTTLCCGAHGYGNVFKLSPNPDGSWTERVLHAFANRPATGPYAGLVLDANVNLYGTTVGGGPADGGTVFKLAPQSDGSWAYSTLHVFQGRPARRPIGGPVLDKMGNLYGTTLECGGSCAGVVFEIMP